MEEKPFKVSGQTYEGDVLGTCTKCGREVRMLLDDDAGKPSLCLKCWEKKHGF